MAGDTGPYETGSLRRSHLREDAGAGGISAGAVSGGPITHSDFAPVIGPKPKLELLRKARKKRKTVDA